MSDKKEKNINWEKEFKDKQAECEQLIAQIEDLQKKPVIDVVVNALNEAMEKIKQVL